MSDKTETWERYCLIEQEFLAGKRQSEIGVKYGITRDHVRQIVYQVRQADKLQKAAEMATQPKPVQNFAPVMRSVPVVRRPPRLEAAPKPVKTVFRMGCMTGGDPLAEVRARQVREARRGRI
jgi:hypothetical protein